MATQPAKVTSVQVSADLHRKIAAARDGRTMAETVRRIIEAGLKALKNGGSK
jgi:predicted DNA-binding protein